MSLAREGVNAGRRCPLQRRLHLHLFKLAHGEVKVLHCLGALVSVVVED